MDQTNLVIGILAHVDAGKTTLSEAMLYRSGSIRKMGRVDNMDAFLDTYEMEKKRGITIFSKQARLMFGEQPVTLLDTPGHADFSAEMERTLQVLDYAILVISGPDGVQGHTHTLWKLLRQYGIPAFLFINKMDQAGTDRAKILKELQTQLSSACLDFTMEEPALFEELAVCDEEAMEEYLESGRIVQERLLRMIRERKVFPCFFGSALKLDGVDAFLEGVGQLTCPGNYPDAFAARVFKIARDEQGKRLTFMKITGGNLKVRDQIGEEKVTQLRIYSGAKYETADSVSAGEICTVLGLSSLRAGDGIGAEQGTILPVLEPVLSYAIELPPGSDVHKAYLDLKQLEDEEPELSLEWAESSGEIHVKLMGDIQMDVLRAQIAERCGLGVRFGEGKIAYKETILSAVEGVGHFEPLRHYAEVHLRLEPDEQGSGLSYASECDENALDRNWQRLILTHLKERVHKGVLTGSPITDMKITLIAGKAHTKHTEGGDFRQATYRAVRQGLMKAQSAILEPYFTYRLEVPQGSLGRAISDIERFSGKFVIEANDGETAVLTGSAPVSEMRGYQKEVASYTGGRGRLIVSMQGYGPCHNPDEVWQEMYYNPERDVENTADSVFTSHGAGVVVPWYAVERYMHLPGAGLPDYSGVTGLDLDWYDAVEEAEEAPLPAGAGEARTIRRQKKAAAGMGGDEELMAIFERTFGPVRPRLSAGSETIRAGEPKEYVYKQKKQKVLKEYLLVDGYNIIFAWDKLRGLAEHNMDAARDTLLEILSGYSGFTGIHVIVVFDAYKVKGFRGEVSRWKNLDVVFTKEAETADQYIEKTAHEIGRKYKVTVATSDGTEQVIIRGQGCLLLSARELQQEIARIGAQIKEEHLDKQERSGHLLGEYMPDWKTFTS